MASNIPSDSSQLNSQSCSKTGPLEDIDENNIERHELVGSGTYGDVYRATLTSKDKKTTTEVAEKVLRPTKPEEREEQKREISFLSRLKHRYIVSFIGAVMSTASIIIITEFASNGSLHDYLKKQTCLPSELLYAWALQGALAIQYLQKNDVVHRDIKTSNFLVTAEKLLKLCDFGIARDLKTTISTHQRGTLVYLAPEVFKDLKLSKASDIYSYGVVLWELVTCEIPYRDLQGLQVLFLVGTEDKRPDITRILPHPLLDLMQRCWATDRVNRPHIDEVIRDIILAGERDRVFKWDLRRSIKCGSSPGPLAILANGEIAVHAGGKIEVYPSPEDYHGNNCLYTINGVDSCHDMALGYKNNLIAINSMSLVIIPQGNKTVQGLYEFENHSHDQLEHEVCIQTCQIERGYEVEREYEVQRKVRQKNVDCQYIAATPTSNKLYSLSSSDPNSLQPTEIPLTLYVEKYILLELRYCHFIDIDLHDRLLVGNSLKIRVLTYDDETKKTHDVTSFQSPENMVFVKARFAPAPKDHADIYAICQSVPAWYNYGIYKYIWGKKSRNDTMSYVAIGCIITGLDEPHDIRITEEGDVICSEAGKNRIVVYQVKSVP